MLRWAREHHCPWDSQTRERSVENGHTEVAQWAEVNGCPDVEEEEESEDEEEMTEEEEGEEEEDLT